MQHTAVNPPSAAARVPLAMFLFLLEPGFAQVHVDVDEAGNDDLAAQVAFDPLLHREIMPDLDDPAVADEDLADLVQTDLRVYYRARS